jgi:uncharacterized protein (TIGR01777 family)
LKPNKFSLEPKTILITGGTGLIGKRLSQLLLNSGHTVRHFSRKEDRSAPIPKYFWNPIQGQMDKSALKGVHIIIHLAGASLANHRWTDTYKKIIVESRTKGTELIADELEKGNYDVEHYISCSGIGYYGAQTVDRIFEESDAPYPDFLSKICQDWEAVTLPISNTGLTTSILRTGVVIAKEGGALPQLSRIARLFVASPVGTGNQWMPWIHIDDLCRMYLHVIDQKLPGTFNACTNDHHSNRSFTKSLAKAVSRPVMVPAIPKFIMRILFGERAVILLEGSRTSADKIISSGFTFKHPTLEEAFKKEAP